MNEPFELPVSYRGKELLFSAQLKQVGYTHAIVVDVDGQQIFFEPDEEKNYRAIVDADKENKPVNIDLLRSIAEGIEAIVK